MKLLVLLPLLGLLPAHTPVVVGVVSDAHTHTQVEAATCRDTFMTPEQAQEAGLIDDIYAAGDDFVTPPAVVKGLQEAGLIDRLSGGVLSVGRPGTLS